jgi:ligand-binding sensor domain-containing protein
MNRVALHRLVFCVIGLAVSHVFVFAAAPEELVSSDFVIREWHSSDGLPSDQIARINQDGAGFLWIATTAGIVRFDGSHFEKYTSPPDTGTSIRVMEWSPRTGILSAMPARMIIMIGFKNMAIMGVEEFTAVKRRAPYGVTLHQFAERESASEAAWYLEIRDADVPISQAYTP